MNEYRTDARTKRKRVVLFRASPLRAVAIIGAIGVLLVALWALFFTQKDARFTCARDESGAGTCEYVVTLLGRVDRESFDVRSLESAHLEEVKKGVHVAHVRIGGKDVAFGHATSTPELEVAARRIDDFAHDKAAPHLDVRLAGAFHAVRAFAMTPLLIALGLAFGGTNRFPRRRLVLDEEAGAARLEQRWLRRWAPEWSRPLSDLRAARTLAQSRSSSIVLDTARDGAVVVVPQSAAHDPAVEEINAFLAED